ncbi:MAG: 4Fe-4S binding protein [Thermoguttaceae bacterium]
MKRLRMIVVFGMVSLFFIGRFVPVLVVSSLVASPFVGVAGLLGLVSNRDAVPQIRWDSTTLIALAILILVIAACFLRHRFLCRNICPLGFCFDLTSAIQKARKRSIQRAIQKERARKVKLDESENENRGHFKQAAHLLRILPPIGIWLVWFTWIGILLGVPGFLWLDPFVICSAVCRFDAVWFGLLVLLLLVFNWFLPLVWCGKFCPLGGMQEILHRPKCPCFDQTTRPKSVEPRTHPRRRFLRDFLVGGLFAGGFNWFFGMNRRDRTSHRIIGDFEYQARLRPPGAVRESGLFSALCTRCGACMQVCPTHLLQPVSIDSDLIDLGTPQVIFRNNWCESTCVQCAKACPSGAIRRMNINEKASFPIGHLVFSFEFCRLYDDVECTICVRACPVEAISSIWSDIEYRRVLRIDHSICTGCGRCLVFCPVNRASGSPQKPLEIVPNHFRSAFNDIQV